MKIFIVFAICIAAASARFIIPSVVADEMAEVQQIIEAINHPSTDPATAAALEQMLQDVLGIGASPIEVGPAIVEGDYEPISVGPAIVEDISPAPVVPTPVVPSPVVPVPEVPAAASSSLVQIIVNINAGASNPVSVESAHPTPVIVAPSPQPEVVPTPVIVAPSPQPEVAPTPVIVAPSPQPEVAPTPVIVAPSPQPEVEPTPVIVAPAPSPVIVVEQPAVAPEPVLVAPIIPGAVITLPDSLN